MRNRTLRLNTRLDLCRAANPGASEGQATSNFNALALASAAVRPRTPKAT